MKPNTPPDFLMTQADRIADLGGDAVRRTLEAILARGIRPDLLLIGALTEVAGIMEEMLGTEAAASACVNAATFLRHIPTEAEEALMLAAPAGRA